ncbi:hypothetical protein DYB35_010179 [Aphanomyces astaci]|uniref:HSF-type DNA-binding domain-containing protein n=1 Tax=Aphanomyces astaci TaxID=112090 RepID=A0A3R7EJG1_APHAT|nr:hypothetical protein DYB35_010179 [Aphanomyces astaci]
MDLHVHKDDGGGNMEKEDKDAVLPAFLSKTYEIFSTPSFASICGWNATGDTIIIHDPDVFVKQVLPRFFKHRNLPSFVRQLNMYGFHKSVLDSNKREFRHKMFLRDKPEMLRLIKRKVNTAPALAAAPAGAAAMELKRDELSHEILHEMRSLKMKNELMEKRLRDVEIDNAIVRSDNLKLWKQLESAKEKQMVMQEKMKKILWVLFQIYRGKHNQVPTLSTDNNGTTILTEELVSGSSRLGPKEFRDVLRFLAMDDPPLLQAAADGSTSAADKLQLPKSAMKKRKFVEVPTISALPAPGTPVMNHLQSQLQHHAFPSSASMNNLHDHFFEICTSRRVAIDNELSAWFVVETSPPRMPQAQKAIKPKKLPKTSMLAEPTKATHGGSALSIFSPLGTIPSNTAAAMPPQKIMSPPPSPLSLEKSHSFDGTHDGSILHTDLMDDDLLLHDDSLNFGEVESENVMRKLEDFESSLLNEYDVTCLDSLLKQIHQQPTPNDHPSSPSSTSTSKLL